MTNGLKAASLALVLATPFAATPLFATAVAAQGRIDRVLRAPAPAEALFDRFGPYGGRAPWSAPWEYDTGSDNDDIPSRPRYQQGGGTQTGGPARNLLPSDRLHLVPR